MSKARASGFQERKIMTHTKLLIDMIEDHLNWLKTGGTEGKRLIKVFVELPNINLSDCDLSASIIRHVNLKGSNLENTNFKHADLSFSDLSNCNLDGVSFKHANLAFANLENAHLHKTDFSYADLTGANFENTNTGTCYLKTAKGFGREDYGE